MSPGAPPLGWCPRLAIGGVIFTATAAVILVGLPATGVRAAHFTAAIDACHAFATTELHTDPNATFPTAKDPRVQATTNEPGRYVVGSFMDAQNGFGAVIRTVFTCAVARRDGDWQLERLDIDRRERLR